MHAERERRLRRAIYIYIVRSLAHMAGLVRGLARIALTKPVELCPDSLNPACSMKQARREMTAQKQLIYQDALRRAFGRNPTLPVP